MLTPTFTSGKLKGMLDPIEEIADDTIDMLARAAIVGAKCLCSGRFEVQFDATKY